MKKCIILNNNFKNDFIKYKYFKRDFCISINKNNNNNFNSYNEPKVSFEHKPSEDYERIESMSYQELKDTVEELGSEVKLKTKPTIHSHLSFIDRMRIGVKAGDGGGGCISFFRAKYIPEGPPDGGNGGDGASIIIKADFDNNNLSHLKKNYKGKSGQKGMGGKKTGKNGDNIILHVPVGTVVRELILKPSDENGEQQQSPEFESHETDSIISKKDPRFDPTSDQFDPALYLKALSAPVIGGKINDPNNVIDHLEAQSVLNKLDKNSQSKWIENGVVTDLSEFGQEVVVAGGGFGGKGNCNFGSGSNRSPEYAQPGTKGEIKRIELELKIIADFGLVGHPNAGKSTLLSVISNAIPNIQNYAFTTLNPYVGVIDFSDVDNQALKERIDSNKVNGIENLSKRKRNINNSNNSNHNVNNNSLMNTIPTSTIADLPGILEGAHLNLGLGLDFLRHIERTKAIVYVLDMSNNGFPAIWDRKKVKVLPNRYAYIQDEEDLIEAKKEIKSKIYDEEYRSPWKDFASLLEELENYKPGLTNKPSIIIANKMDGEYSESHLEEFTKATKSLFKGKDWKIIPASAKNNQNILSVKKELKEVLKRLHVVSNLNK
ncbi:hypothetical protein RB653_003225 [Dictyostelium firmibasis]|uniref:GTP-binding protein Obg/CgtA n=1 Tax=Dictyostelium firmibasis TaxID=79012 RepID=A0AAN7YNS4_9MYCE